MHARGWVRKHACADARVSDRHAAVVRCRARKAAETVRGQGDVFGELAALGGQLRGATVVTTLASEVLVLSRRAGSALRHHRHGGVGGACVQQARGASRGVGGARAEQAGGRAKASRAWGRRRCSCSAGAGRERGHHGQEGVGAAGAEQVWGASGGAAGRGAWALAAAGYTVHVLSRHGRRAGAWMGRGLWQLLSAQCVCALWWPLRCRKHIQIASLFHTQGGTRLHHSCVCSSLRQAGCPKFPASCGMGLLTRPAVGRMQGPKLLLRRLHMRVTCHARGAALLLGCTARPYARRLSQHTRVARAQAHARTAAQPMRGAPRAQARPAEPGPGRGARQTGGAGRRVRHRQARAQARRARRALSRSASVRRRPCSCKQARGRAVCLAV